MKNYLCFLSIFLLRNHFCFFKRFFEHLFQNNFWVILLNFPFLSSLSVSQSLLHQFQQFLLLRTLIKISIFFPILEFLTSALFNILCLTGTCWWKIFQIVPIFVLRSSKKLNFWLKKSNKINFQIICQCVSTFNLIVNWSTTCRWTCI